MVELNLMLLFVSAVAAVVTAFDDVGASQLGPGAGQNRSSSASDVSDAGVVESGYQIADVSGEQACGGDSFDYSRFWVGPLPDGDDTKLSCVSGYRCEAQGAGQIFWCKQHALPLNTKCGGYLFYTLFKCVDGTVCTIDPARFEPRCLPVDNA